MPLSGSVPRVGERSPCSRLIIVALRAGTWVPCYAEGKKGGPYTVTATAPDPMEAVNRTGYPLQIALGHEVDSRAGVHGWRVLYREHSWKNGSDDREGFIDLVLEHQVMQIVLVVECKRVRDGDWVFLPQNGDAGPRRAAGACRVEHPPGSPSLGIDWVNCPVDPRSPEAAFCVMPRDSCDPNVDSLASELVSATEALAYEELPYLLARRRPLRRLYYPLIATTARLSVCSFDPADIALDTGVLPPSSMREEFAFVRYTKQLSTRGAPLPADLRPGTEPEHLASAKARTVFIVVADQLDRFLTEFHE